MPCDECRAYLDRAEKAERERDRAQEMAAHTSGNMEAHVAISQRALLAEARVAELENILRGQLPHDPHYDGPSDIKARAALSSSGSAAAEVLRVADEWAINPLKHMADSKTQHELRIAIDAWRESRGYKRPDIPKGPTLIQDDGT